MQLKIYINDTAIYLTDALSAMLTSIKKNVDVWHIKPTDELDIAAAMQNINTSSYSTVIIEQQNFEQLKNNFFKYFTIVQAAGGIVQNSNKAILFIYRRGKWDLPKGKLELNETIETCAAREVEEETGVTELQLKHKVGETYHIYTEKKLTILKISHWYYFTTISKVQGVPQVEEDIEEVQWITTQNIKKPMANTYQNIKDILSIFFDTP